MCTSKPTTLRVGALAVRVWLSKRLSIGAHRRLDRARVLDYLGAQSERMAGIGVMIARKQQRARRQEASGTRVCLVQTPLTGLVS